MTTAGTIALETETLLVKNPLLETSPFDSDADELMMLCKLPNGDRSVRFALPKDYLDLIDYFDGERSISETVIAFLGEYKGSRKDKDKSWWQKLIIKSLLVKGLLIRVGDDPATAAHAKQGRRAFLYIKLPLSLIHI